MKLAITAKNVLLFLLPFTLLLAVAAPLNPRSDIANTDLDAEATTDLLISSISTADDSETSLSEVDNNSDIAFVGGDQGTYNVYLRPDEGEKMSVGKRQVSPWPHFRECKKDDPRPECHRYKRTSPNDSQGFDALFEETKTAPLQARQISPRPHFRECKPNDPRPECPHHKTPQLNPWPHFRQCVKNDPRPHCPRNRRWNAGFEGENCCCYLSTSRAISS